MNQALMPSGRYICTGSSITGRVPFAEYTPARFELTARGDDTMYMRGIAFKIERYIDLEYLSRTDAEMRITVMA